MLGADFFNGKFVLKLLTGDNKRAFSEKFTVKNEQWGIYTELCISEGQKFLGLYLTGVGNKSQLALCFSLKILSTIDEKHEITRNTYFDFKIINSVHDSWGWSKFISYSRLEDLTYGYIKDGKLEIEVDVTAV